MRRFRSPHTRVPHTQFLSNGNYVTSVTNAGGGASVWRGLPVTRWRRDATRDADGQFIYLRDVRSGDVWSATFQPTRREPDDYDVTFSADRATFRRRDDDISTQLDVAVSTEDDVEVRRITVRNHGTRIREIDVTSYAEIVLTSAANDLAHPAFGKLFVETEYLADSAALLCHRRPRDPGDAGAWAFHALSLEGRPQGPVEWETDRARFLGRGRSPARPQALDGRALSGTTGVVLDPIVSLRQRIRLAPGGHGAAVLRDRHGRRSRNGRGARAQVPRRRAPRRARSRWRSRTPRAACAISASPPTTRAVRAARLARARHRRVAPRARRHARRQRAGPARPVAARHLRRSAHPARPRRRRRRLPLVRQVLQAQEYWRLKGLRADVVILNEQPVSYLDEMQAQLTALLEDGPWSTWQHRPGGAYLLRADAWAAPSACCSKRWRARSCAATAATCARSSIGPMRSGPPRRARRRRQLARPPRPRTARVPLPAHDVRQRTRRVHRRRPHLRDRRSTAPRKHRCHGRTSSPTRLRHHRHRLGRGAHVGGNSRENRLTPFANDPVSDPTGEALFVRDDETGEFWSPTPGPDARASAADRCVVRHTAGVTRFARATHGIGHELDVFVDADDPVKFSLLTLTNHGPRIADAEPLRLQRVGARTAARGDHLHVVTDVDQPSGAVFATQRLQPGIRGRVAFSYASERRVSCTADRRAFIGRNGDLSRPPR